MEFKVFLLCLTILVAVTSSATVSKREDKKDTVSKFTVKVEDGDKEVDEEIEVDSEKETETVQIPKTDSSTAGEVKILYDFKKNLAMQRLSAAKACFLSDSTENAPKPDDLVKAVNQKSAAPARNDSDTEYQDVSTLTDVERSELSDEMKSMCEDLPIYRIKKLETGSGRSKRWWCRYYWYRYCYYRCWWGCRRYCRYIIIRRCYW